MKQEELTKIYMKISNIEEKNIVVSKVKAYSVYRNNVSALRLDYVLLGVHAHFFSHVSF